MTSCPSCGWSQSKVDLERSLREYASLGLLIFIVLAAIAWIVAREVGLALILGLLAAASIAGIARKYRWSSCTHSLLGPRYQIAYLIMKDTQTAGTTEPDIERATRFLAAEAAHPVSLGAASFLGVRDISPTAELVYLWPRDAAAIEKNLRALMAYISDYPNESRDFVSNARQLLQILTTHYGDQTQRLEQRWAIYRTTIERLGNETFPTASPSIQSDESKAETEPQPQAERYEPSYSDREEMERYEQELWAAENAEYERTNEEKRIADERRAAREQHEATMKAHADRQAQYEYDCSRAERGQVP